MAKMQCLDNPALDLGDLSDLLNMTTNQQSLSASDDFLLSLLNGTDQPVSTVDLSELDPSPASSLSSHPSSPSSLKTVASPHSTTQTIPEGLHPLAGGVSDPLFCCLSDITLYGRACDMLLYHLHLPMECYVSEVISTGFSLVHLQISCSVT
jgi:hypothetical protein